MYVLPRSNDWRRSPLVHTYVPVVEKPVLSEPDRIKQQLRTLGASRAVLMTSEAKHLPKVIHANENIEGVMYGHAKDGFAMILATDKRVVFVDKKPFFVNEDEITYDVVSGISHGHAGIGSTVTLHTRMKDYKLQTFNEKCAHGFVEAIEAHCVDYRNMQFTQPHY
jgi:hypothetical protein